MIQLKQNLEFIKINSTIIRLLMLLSLLFIFSGATLHPIYVSVTEIEYNSKENTLEISCKVFTGDLETVLRKNSKIKVDLLAPRDKKAMEALVNNYILQHLKITVNEKQLQLSFLGYEQNEEMIQSYFEVGGVNSIQKIVIHDDILYEYQSEQISIIHLTVDGKRRSTKLNNPEFSYIVFPSKK